MSRGASADTAEEEEAFTEGVARGRDAGGQRPRLVHPGQHRAHSLANHQRCLTWEIAEAGDGQYLELGRQSDRDIANRIISATRRRAGSAAFALMASTSGEPGAGMATV